MHLIKKIQKIYIMVSTKKIKQHSLTLITNVKLAF